MEYVTAAVIILLRDCRPPSFQASMTTPSPLKPKRVATKPRDGCLDMCFSDKAGWLHIGSFHVG